MDKATRDSPENGMRSSVSKERNDSTDNGRWVMRCQEEEGSLSTQKGMKAVWEMIKDKKDTEIVTV